MLEDPPAEVVAILCPSCEMLEDAREERKGGQHGIHLAFRMFTDPEPEPSASEED